MAGRGSSGTEVEGSDEDKISGVAAKTGEDLADRVAFQTDTCRSILKEEMEILSNFVGRDNLKKLP